MNQSADERSDETNRQLHTKERVTFDAELVPLLLTIDSAAFVLSLSRSRIYELIAEQTLPTVRIGRSTRISAKALASFVEQLEEATSTQSL